MNEETEKRKSEIREFLVGDYAEDLASQFDEKEIFHVSLERFQESQQWSGFDEAFQSWKNAVWRWIDSGITPNIENAWRQKLWANHIKISQGDRSKSAAMKDNENGLQQYLLKRAEFMDGLRHKKEGDPKWFKRMGSVFYCAYLLDDDTVPTELARLTQRKTSQDVKGRRSLKLWLRRLWIPGCFWAMTNAGISNCLAWRHPNLRYSEGRIKNVISELKLWRPQKPPYWGIDKNGQLLPL